MSVVNRRAKRYIVLEVRFFVQQEPTNHEFTWNMQGPFPFINELQRNPEENLTSNRPGCGENLKFYENEPLSLPCIYNIIITGDFNVQSRAL